MPYFIENVIADSVFALSTDPEALTYTIDPSALHGSLSSWLTIGAAS